jgi:hypothetical protein
MINQMADDCGPGSSRYRGRPVMVLSVNGSHCELLGGILNVSLVGSECFTWSRS